MDLGMTIDCVCGDRGHVHHQEMKSASKCFMPKETETTVVVAMEDTVCTICGRRSLNDGDQWLSASTVQLASMLKQQSAMNPVAASNAMGKRLH